MNSVSVLDLRSIFGVHARITKSGSTTGGAFVEMDCTAEPGSGTMVHFHPEQDESFEVVEGQIEVLREGRWMPVPAGECYSVPKGAVHAWRNAAEINVGCAATRSRAMFAARRSSPLCRVASARTARTDGWSFTGASASRIASARSCCP